jgi:hypothetical protein
LRITALVRGLVARLIMRAVIWKPSFSWAWTRMGRAPARRAASLKVGQWGEGMMTSSPRFKRAWQTTYRACFPPFVMRTFSGAKETLKSLR